MTYFELKINTQPNPQNINPEELSDILVAELEEFEFESYFFENNFLYAYTNHNIENLNSIKEILDKYGVDFQINTVDQVNWNQLWESNFEPVFIDEKVYIKADFHPEEPNALYTIRIHPKMSFGTGHHPTTALMIRSMLVEDFKDKSLIDIGAGTGVLAILGHKLGARFIAATEIEEFALENCKENFLKNEITEFNIIDYNLQKDIYGSYDLILANINKNVHLEQCSLYFETLNPGGKIFISGFYESDNDDIIQKFEQTGFEFINGETQQNWSRLTFKRP